MLGFGEELLLRVPVVKTVYSAIRDMTRLVNTEKKKGDLDRVVTLDFGFGKLIGFVTQEHANTLGIGGGDDLVAVYLPMSYQIGGYTVYLPRSRLTETELSVEQAMRIVLTGGVRENREQGTDRHDLSPAIGSQRRAGRMVSIDTLSNSSSTRFCRSGCVSFVSHSSSRFT